MLARAHIIGHLGKDPEVRTLGNGNKVVTLSVATSKKWREKDSGERKEKTFWHRVVIYNKAQAEACEKFLKKGAKVAVFGDLETRDYEKDGEQRTITEILVSAFQGEVIFLDKREGGGGDPVPAADDERFDDLPY
jgi:single-strand DNA-binding protein